MNQCDEHGNTVLLETYTEDGVISNVRTNEYDADGNLIQYTAGDYTYVYEYDEHGNMIHYDMLNASGQSLNQEIIYEYVLAYIE